MTGNGAPESADHPVGHPVNVLTEEAPGIRLCFNTTPEDTVDSLRRWIQA